MASYDQHNQSSSPYNTTHNNQGYIENFKHTCQGAIDRAKRGDYKLLLALGATGVGAYACYKVIQRHNPDKDWQAICYIISTNPFVYVPLGVALNELKNYALGKPEIEPSDLQHISRCYEDKPNSLNEGLARGDNRDRTVSIDEVIGESSGYSQSGTYQESPEHKLKSRVELRDPPRGFNQESVPNPMYENPRYNPNRAFGSQAPSGTSRQQAPYQSRYTQQQPYVSQPPPTGLKVQIGDVVINSEVNKNVDGSKIKLNNMSGLRELKIGDKIQQSKYNKTVLKFKYMDEFGEKHSHYGDNLKQHMKDVGIQGSQTNIDHGENEGQPMSRKNESKQLPKWQQVQRGNPSGGILISDEWDGDKFLHIEALRCSHDHAYASSICYLEIRDPGLFELADDLEVLLEECENLDTIIFKSYHFFVFGMNFFEFKRICRSITIFRNNIKYLEFSNMKNFGEEHANLLGKLIQDVKVKTLNLHGSNLEQYMKVDLSSYTNIVFGNSQVGILISDEWDGEKLRIEALRCRQGHSYASSIRYLEIRDSGFHHLAYDLEFLLEKCENLDTIIFKSYQFDDSGIFELGLKRICRSITKCRNNMKYLEFSNMKDFGEEHAKILGQLIQDVKVETLNLHGSNLEQYLHDVFIVSMKKSPSAHRTNIVFGQDEVNCLVQQTGTVKEFGLSGCKITVPTNALAEPKQITLQVLASLVNGPGNLVQVSPVLRFLPSGLHFNKPITVQVPVWNVFKGDSNNLTVFKRFDENADWKEECVVKYTGGKFIQYKTNHFCDDVVCANVEEECQYQLMVYKSIYTNMNDSYELHIYCIPSNQDIANKVHRDAQSCEFKMCFPPLRFTLSATGHIEVKVEQEDPLLDCNVVEGRKVFECANLGNYHTTYIRCDLSDDTKRRGIVLKFTAMVNQRSEVKLIKAIWKEPPPGDRVIVVQNLHSVHNTTCSVDEINVVARNIDQLNIASRYRNVWQI